MQFEKKSVRLGDIRPSEQNPREDFGDIGALARSIEATGGEPLNPPVVVADGNVFRIVDGERRYRALSSIYGEVRSFECRCATVSTANGDGSGASCFVGPTDISDLFALACGCADTLCAAFSQAGIPDRNARKLVLIPALGANPHGHADSIQTTDLDARREIRDMAAELGVDADI